MLGVYYHDGLRFAYTDNDRKATIQCYDDDMQLSGTIQLDDDTEWTDNYACPLPDGGFAIMYMYAVYDGDMSDVQAYFDNADISFRLKIFSPDGELLSDNELDGFERYFTFGETFINSISPYGENYIIHSREGYFLISPDGEVLDSLNADKNAEFVTLSDGSVISYESGGWAYMDGETLSLPAEYNSFGKYINCMGAAFPGSGEYKAYFSLNKGIFGLTQDDTVIQLMSFTDSNVAPSYVSFGSFAGEGRFAMLRSDQSSGELVFSLLTIRPESWVDSRSPVILGTTDRNSNNADTIVLYNKKSDNYIAEIRQYDKADDLKLDILAGDPPDLFDGGTAAISRYVNLGAFENLYDLMDEREGLSREDIFEPVLRAFEYSDGLYALPAAYHIDAWIANREVIGREYSNWNLEEFFSFAENLPEGMYLGSKNSPFMSREMIWNSLFNSAVVNFVDYENAACNFDSEEFIHLLDFANTAEPNEAYDWGGVLSSNNEEQMIQYREAELAIKNKTALLQQMWSNFGTGFINGSHANGLYLDDNFTYLIDPSDDRRGQMWASNDHCYSIITNAPHPDGAWDMFCFIMGEKYQMSYMQISDMFCSNKKAMEKKLDDWFYWNDQMKFDMDGGHDSPKSGGVYADNVETVTYKLPEETKQYLLDFINSCDKLKISDSTIFDICTEEAEKLFAGETTAEACAAMIQNRVSIYLSENS